MKIVLSFDGDGIGAKIGRAKLSNNPTTVKVVNQSINLGNKVFEDFALRTAGDIIEIGGDEGTISFDSAHLPEVEGLRRDYFHITGATVSVGLGSDLASATKALLAAKLQGKDRTTYYSEDVEKILESQKQESESEKISQEYLGKSAEAQKIIDELNYETPPSAPAPNMQEMVEKFHELAGNSMAKKQHKTPETTKNKVVKIIEFLKQNPEQLQELKRKNPEIYEKMRGLVSSIIEIVRDGQLEEVEQPLEEIPDEDMFLNKSEEKINKIKHLVNTTNGSAWQTEGGEFVVVGLDPHNRSQWRATSLDSEGEHKFHRVAKDHEAALGVAESLGVDLMKPPKQIMPKRVTETLDKSGDPGKTGRHHIVLPVGSIKPTGSGSRDSGKMKVKSPSGKDSWISVKAGIIMSPSGQPTSSLNPQGLKPKK